MGDWLGDAFGWIADSATGVTLAAGLGVLGFLFSIFNYFRDRPALDLLLEVHRVSSTRALSHLDVHVVNVGNRGAAIAKVVLTKADGTGGFVLTNTPSTYPHFATPCSIGPGAVLRVAPPFDRIPHECITEDETVSVELVWYGSKLLRRPGGATKRRRTSRIVSLRPKDSDS